MEWKGLMYVWLAFALVFAFLQAIAVSGNLQPLEYIAKPAVMVFLFLWLYTRSGLQGNLLWFGLGILFSLAGDLLLMISSDRMFLFGLVAFLFAHIFYITGFCEELTTFHMWSLILVILIAMSVGLLIRRIVRAMRANGKNKLVGPVILYGTVISVMLYAAMSTIDVPAWKTSAALFVSAGAFLFCASDAILAWNKFVFPIRNGRVWNIVLYHLGQIGLIAGVISQFA
jgi:alkenylglycerophosphocholine hydrolase